ncbi:MAG: cyclase family protein [Alphaproteobacteria bacterium]|nr:cyclase family protein [Alphaproteobacteria bacterium]
MKYIDLTMSIEAAPAFEGNKAAEFECLADFARDGWNEHRMAMDLHVGTHIDFPFHMIDGGKVQKDFGLDDFIGRGRLIDVRGMFEIEVPLDGVEVGDILLFWTGRSDSAAEDSDRYFDSASSPRLSEKFAAEIVRRGVKIVGIDSWSVDVAPFPVHKILLGGGVLIVENLLNLGALVGREFKVFVAPLRHESYDGAPARVFAELVKLAAC